MPKIPPEGMSQVIPYLYYADVPKAVDWLVRAFGFEKIMAFVVPAKAGTQSKRRNGCPGFPLARE